MKLRLVLVCSLVLAGPAAAEEAAVRITRQDCARIVQHRASADVAYKPGVDARGKAVAPADLPGSGNTLKVLPDVLEFPVSINPFTYKNLNRVKGTENTSMAMGTVRYDIAKGAWTWNDQPLGSAEEAAIAESCARRGIK